MEEETERLTDEKNYYRNMFLFYLTLSCALIAVTIVVRSMARTPMVLRATEAVLGMCIMFIVPLTWCGLNYHYIKVKVDEKRCLKK